MRAVLIRQIKNKWVEITFEIYDLALAAGYEIVEEVIYHNNKPHPVHYISQSKLQDLLYLIPTFDIEKIIVDDVLSIKHFNDHKS